MSTNHTWKFFRAGGFDQVKLETGADLLKGDFSRLPALQTRARKYNQECKRYLSIHKPKA